MLNNGDLKVTIALVSNGVHIALLEEYMAEALTTDRALFESIKQYLSPDDLIKREKQLINAGKFLGVIRHSL
jgi:hypothetical protein